MTNMVIELMESVTVIVVGFSSEEIIPCIHNL